MAGGAGCDNSNNIFEGDFRRQLHGGIPLHQGRHHNHHLYNAGGIQHRACDRVADQLGTHIATFYVELIRGIPVLVLIFFIALVGVPVLVEGLAQLANRLGNLGNPLRGLRNDTIPMNARAIIALSITFGAYLSETFRAGIQSVPKGQMEAARSQRMSHGQAMLHIILPQAFRNILPAIGNEFISLLKDSSLVSVLAVRDITQLSRLYAGSTFQFRESYLTLSILYLSMTLVLSSFVKFIERRSRRDQR